MDRDHADVAERRGEALLASVRAHIEEQYADRDLSIAELARRYFVSRRHLEVLFAQAGSSPAAYLRSTRLRNACLLLTEHAALPVSEVAQRVGFSNANTFIRAFRREYDATPHRWRQQAARR